MRRTKGLPLGSIRGVPLTLTAGWALIAAVMTAVFTPIVEARLDLALVPAVLVALGVPLLLALSVLIHEIAHGVTAEMRGFEVREYVITLWGGHTTFMSEIDRPGAAAGVAFAGPATNLLLAGLGWWLAPLLGPIGSFLALTLALTNAFVGVFNLLPASPLDGGKLLEAAIWRATGDRWLGMRVAGWLGRATAVVLVVGFVAWPYYAGTRSTVTVVTGIIVGMVIWQGAGQTIKAATVRAATEGFSLAPYLTPAAIVTPHTPIPDIPGLPAVVLGAGGREQVGIIDPAALAAVPGPQRGATPASAVQATAHVCVVSAPGGPAAVSQIAGGLKAGASVYLFNGSAPGHYDRLSVIDIDAVLAELKERGA